MLAFLLFLELSLSFPTTSEATGTDKKVKTKVLVLGAGLSGITAAKLFLITTSRIFMSWRVKITLEGEFMRSNLRGFALRQELTGFIPLITKFQKFL